MFYFFLSFLSFVLISFSPIPLTSISGPIFSHMNPTVNNTTKGPPRVLIAGGGLGGLFLGILLEKAGIPYEIFERSAEIKPLGIESPLKTMG
jgi:hypothetical protein